jgi:hypothetical protein
MSAKSPTLEEQRSRLERRANVIRSRLLRTIDQFDTRRHQVTEIGHQAKRLAVPVVASVIGAAILTAGTTLAIRALVGRHREQKLGYRVTKALAPFRREQRQPFWQQALQKMALAALPIVASELVKRGAKAIFSDRVARRTRT